MILNTATIVNYKNIAEARLEFSPKLNCLIGNNGQGKTNVLDAIYYMSMCRSFASTGRAATPARKRHWKSALPCSAASARSCAATARSTSG